MGVLVPRRTYGLRGVVKHRWEGCADFGEDGTVAYWSRECRKVFRSFWGVAEGYAGFFVSGPQAPPGWSLLVANFLFNKVRKVAMNSVQEGCTCMVSESTGQKRRVRSLDHVIN
jgi:hypothetical protein